MRRRRKRKHLRGRNRHHLVPVSRKGNNSLANLLLIHIERHIYWHKVFGNMRIEEVLALLTRMARMKAKQKEARMYLCLCGEKFFDIATKLQHIEKCEEFRRIRMGLEVTTEKESHVPLLQVVSGGDPEE